VSEAVCADYRQTIAHQMSKLPHLWCRHPTSFVSASTFVNGLRDEAMFGIGMGSGERPAKFPSVDTEGLRRPDRDRISKAARHQHIVAQLTAAPMLRASELAEALGVSGETIRRDLIELHERKLINRTYGGAARPFAHEQAVGDRKAVMVPERDDPPQ
jgi:hypothetical protein